MRRARFAVGLLNALCQFHLALADSEILALYDLGEPDLLEYEKKENDVQWQVGSRASWDLRLKFTSVYCEPLQGTRPNLARKSEISR